jgi:hypothetical protein
MTQAELAQRMGRPKEKINELIKGKAPLSMDTAGEVSFRISLKNTPNPGAIAVWLRIGEKEADNFAANMLIPSLSYERWKLGVTFFGTEIIRQFAQEIGIHPGIVVGRLQFDQLLKPAFHNDLKQAIRFD